VPLPEDLGVYAVSAAPYLNGMGEAVEELRRRMLDLLRTGHLEVAEATLKLMVEIYDLLAALEYPDAMTGGLPRTTDVARSLIERSRADLTSTIVQEGLRRELVWYVKEIVRSESVRGPPRTPHRRRASCPHLQLAGTLRGPTGRPDSGESSDSTGRGPL
jgi:hypothetical protein